MISQCGQNAAANKLKAIIYLKKKKCFNKLDNELRKTRDVPALGNIIKKMVYIWMELFIKCTLYLFYMYYI